MCLAWSVAALTRNAFSSMEQRQLGVRVAVEFLCNISVTKSACLRAYDPAWRRYVCQRVLERLGQRRCGCRHGMLILLRTHDPRWREEPESHEKRDRTHGRNALHREPQLLEPVVPGVCADHRRNTVQFCSLILEVEDDARWNITMRKPGEDLINCREWLQFNVNLDLAIHRKRQRLRHVLTVSTKEPRTVMQFTTTSRAAQETLRAASRPERKYHVYGPCRCLV